MVTGMPKLLRMTIQPLLSNTRMARTDLQGYRRSCTRPSWRLPPQKSSNPLNMKQQNHGKSQKEKNR